MPSSRRFARLGLLLAALAAPTTQADEPIAVVASFSILADMVENIGGEHVVVTSLVPADSDTHVFSPRPTDARAVAEADLVVFNGLNFEGWMERLIDASGHKGPVVVATRGIDAPAGEEPDHREADHDDPHDHGERDPHAWQDPTLARQYVANIRDGLIETDPGHEAAYRDGAERYLDALEATDAEIRRLLEAIPPTSRVVTGHDSFGYFAAAYGVRFLSPAGLSTGVDPSATDMARLIDVIREQSIQALFHESMTNPTTIDQLAEETGVPVAGTLYADALAAEGEAASYLGMMRHNARVLHDALAAPDAAER